MIVKILTEHHLECLSLKGGCRGSSESTLVKMSNCWKSHAAALYVWVLLEASNEHQQHYKPAHEICVRIALSSKPSEKAITKYKLTRKK